MASDLTTGGWLEAADPGRVPSARRQAPARKGAAVPSKAQAWGRTDTCPLHNPLQLCPAGEPWCLPACGGFGSERGGVGLPIIAFITWTTPSCSVRQTRPHPRASNKVSPGPGQQARLSSPHQRPLGLSVREQKCGLPDPELPPGGRDRSGRHVCGDLPVNWADGRCHID